MKCWPWNHDWTVWETFESGLLVATADALGLPIQEESERPIRGAWERQRRVCGVCGKSQMREVKCP